MPKAKFSHFKNKRRQHSLRDLARLGPLARRIFGLRVWTDVLIFRGFWVHFGRSVALVLEVFFDTLPDLAKNAAPHESTVNSSRNEGLVLGTTIKKPFQKMEK